MKRTVLSAFLLLQFIGASIAPACYAASPTSKATPAHSVQKVSEDKTRGIAEYKLPGNGLQVLLAERHHTPLVTVMVVYHVGSRNEAVGYTGSTHFLEHMLFKGTTRHDPLKGTGIDDILKPIGGINNATTFYDRTNYYETVPAQYLPLALEIEADRMRNALLREKDRSDEMAVVRNELERNEDEPDRMMDVQLFAQAFAAHPYHHPVIGWRSDVEGVPTARLRQFYNDFYYPNNATLVVIGDFKTSEALNQINKLFGPIKAAPRPFPTVYTKEPPQIGERRFNIKKGEDLPKVVVGFHIPQATDKDTYPLEVAAALLGSDSKLSSRLYNALVDKGLASDTYAYNYSLRDPGLFTVMATATPDTDTDKLEDAIFTELNKLQKEEVSDAELDKAKKSIWKNMKIEATDPMRLASQLAEAIAVADWRWWADLEKNIKAVSKEDIARVTKKYFVRSNATVGHYHPLSKKDKAAVEPAYRAALLNPIAAEYKETPRPQSPKNQRPATGGGAAAKAAAPQTASIADQVQKKVLSNGLTVLTLPVPGSGVVSMAAKIRAGSYFRPQDMQDLPEITAEMLDKGSAKFNKEDLAKQLEIMGTSLNFGAGNFWLSFNSDVVKEDLPQFVALTSDVLKSPTFPAEELDKVRKQASARIQAAMADSGQVASNAFYGKLYKPECVYYAPPFKEQLDQLSKMTADQLRTFHRDHITPANTYIAIVGDIEPSQAFSLVEKNFGSWSGPAADKIRMDYCVNDTATGQKVVNNLADKSNVEVMFGSAAPLSIKSKDFYAASIANSALGHDTVSSRLAELRTKHGLTYGIGSYFTENAFENGAWVVAFTVNPENLTRAQKVVNQIISDYISKGITDKELKEEAQRLGGEFVVERMRTPHQLADALTKYEFLGLGARFLDDYPKLLRSVTRAQVNNAIKKYFSPDKVVTSIAGSVEKK